VPNLLAYTVVATYIQILFVAQASQVPTEVWLCGGASHMSRWRKRREKARRPLA